MNDHDSNRERNLVVDKLCVGVDDVCQLETGRTAQCYPEKVENEVIE